MDHKVIRPVRSTGNDIVALDAISRERTGQARFYNKILALSEQALYEHEGSGEIPFENFVWMLWSVKEAVYKYQKRIRPELLFSPTKIVVGEMTRVCGDVAGRGDVAWREGKEWKGVGANGVLYEGKAKWREDIFYFRSVIQDRFIATVVSEDEDFSGVEWGVQAIDDAGQAEQSRAVRELVLRRLDLLLGDQLPVGDDGHVTEGSDAVKLRIEKNEAGCPVLLRGGKELGIAVSLAHHDRYVAYSFRMG